MELESQIMMATEATLLLVLWEAGSGVELEELFVGTKIHRKPMLGHQLPQKRKRVRTVASCRQATRVAIALRESLIE